MELEQVQGTREERVAYLAQALQGLFAGEPTPAPLPGGRTAGLKHLRVFNVAKYQERRNDVGPTAGASRLSPYIRHGCVSLIEARRDALDKIGAEKAYKFIQELAWREFWQLQWERWGDRILAENMEEPKVPLGNSREVPADIAEARTRLNCIDTSLRSLYREGYLYNHGRMWVASYLVHHRKVAWQAGAQLFYRFLLDGDPASNSLSWQWVASTFSHKPYIFNRDNVERYSRDPKTGRTYCSNCPAARNNTCPFDAPYPVLGRRLFGRDYSMEDDFGHGRRGGDGGGGDGGRGGFRDGGGEQRPRGGGGEFRPDRGGPRGSGGSGGGSDRPRGPRPGGGGGPAGPGRPGGVAPRRPPFRG